jgi:hypothetical protein
MSSAERLGSFESGGLKYSQEDRREKALRILARMIVRAYLGEIARGEAGPLAYRESETEVKNANKRWHRGY